MPRVKLDPNYWQYIVRDELRKHRQADIADALGVSQQSVSYKTRHMSYTLSDFIKIVRATGMDDETILRITKGGTR